jgi:hypothetical protein
LFRRDSFYSYLILLLFLGIRRERQLAWGNGLSSSLVDPSRLANRGETQGGPRRRLAIPYPYNQLFPHTVLAKGRRRAAWSFKARRWNYRPGGFCKISQPWWRPGSGRRTAAASGHSPQEPLARATAYTAACLAAAAFPPRIRLRGIVADLFDHPAGQPDIHSGALLGD